MTIIACLSCSIGCAQEPEANLQSSEQLHFRSDRNRWEMSAAGLAEAKKDCRFEPSPADDPIEPAEREGQVLMTDGFVSHLLNECARNQRPKP